MIMWSSLMAGKDGEVDGTFKVVQDFLASLRIGFPHTFSVKNHSASGTSERFVGGCGDDVGMIEGRGDNSCGYQSRDMRHVDDKVGATEIGDFSHPLVVDEAAVGGGTGDDYLWSIHEGVFFKHFVVDDSSVKADSIWEGFKIC